jgi:uncharacterized membrane protein
MACKLPRSVRNLPRAHAHPISHRKRIGCEIEYEDARATQTLVIAPLRDQDAMSVHLTSQSSRAMPAAEDFRGCGRFDLLTDVDR